MVILQKYVTVPSQIILGLIGGEVIYIIEMKNNILFKWNILHKSILLVKYYSSPLIIKVNNGILFVALEILNKWETVDLSK